MLSACFNPFNFHFELIDDFMFCAKIRIDLLQRWLSDVRYLALPLAFVSDLFIKIISQRNLFSEEIKI